MHVNALAHGEVHGGDCGSRPGSALRGVRAKPLNLGMGNQSESASRGERRKNSAPKGEMKWLQCAATSGRPGPDAAEKAVSGQYSALQSGNVRSRFINVLSVLMVSRAPLQGG